MYSIATILGVSIDYFYDDMDMESFLKLPEYSKIYGATFLREDEVEQKFEPLNGAEATMLLKAYFALPAKARTALMTMLTSLRERTENNNE